MLLDGPGICFGRTRILERSRRFASKDPDRWDIAFDRIVIPSEVEGSRKVTLMESLASPPFGDCVEASTPLCSARNDVSAVLLAGGESRRMGTDKATFLFRGKPLWQVQLETLRRLRPTEIFVSARTDPSWRPADVRFIPDIPPSCGPLSGLAASLAKIHTAYLVALAIDMPFMTANYLRSMCDMIEPGRGVVAKIDNRAEPLASLYPREAEIDFRVALAGTDFSLQNLVRHLVTSGKLLEISVMEQERPLFRNVNNVSDLDAMVGHG